MQIIHDHSYITQAEQDFIARSYASKGLYSLRFSFVYTEAQRAENRAYSDAAGLTSDAWSAHAAASARQRSEHMEQIAATLAKNFKVYQYDSREAIPYNSDWDLFFWCSDFSSTMQGLLAGRNYGYFTLSFNGNHGPELAAPGLAGRKQKFISQVMTSRTPLRSCEDVDETALSFAEIKALCAGDPRIKERMELDVEASRLRIMKADYQFKKFQMEDDAAKRIPAKISQTEAMITGIRADMDTLKAHPYLEGGFAGMKVHGRNYLEKEKAGEALLDAVAAVSETEPVEIGSYRGFTVTAQLNAFGGHNVSFKGAVVYTIDLGESATGNITRIDNALVKLLEHMKEYQAKLADLRQQLESAKAEVAKPFAMEAELQAKSARLAELDAALNLGHKGPEDAAAA